jgi:glycogen(starch) synthase
VTRVLTLTTWYPPHHSGGYELSCFDVTTRLVARGHDVRVVCSADRLPDAAAADPDHERLVHRELEVYFRDGAPYAPSFGRRLEIERHNRSILERHLADFQPEVVAVWHMGALSLSLLDLISARQLPIVYAICDDWLAYGEALDAWAAPFAGSVARRAAGRAVELATRTPVLVGDLGATGAFCFISESTRSRAIADGRWWYRRSTVLYSGIDRELFTPPARIDDVSWDWRLVYAGRLDPRKGVDTAVAALPLLPPAATLTFDGRGEASERARLEETARGLGVAERLTFTVSSRTELAQRYRDADVVVFPSEWQEPFGLVPLEAMACGTPVVATGTGGSREFLRDGYNCLLFPAGDAGALATAVRRLGSDPELRRSVIEGGLHTAEQLDSDHLADAFEAWLLAAAQAFRSGEPPARVLDLPLPDPGPLARHQAATPSVLAGGDPDAIKRLYVDLGRDWWEAGGVEDVPVLSVPETHRAVEARLSNVHGMVLDAGCGPNPALSIALGAAASRTVVALDIGWGTVRVGREIAARRGVEILGIVADVERLPFRSGAFDALACDDTIEHLPDDAAGVRELARVLRTGGRAVLATPNRSEARVVKAKVRDRLRGVHKPENAYYCSNSHLREYTWHEFERLTRPAFRVRGRHGVGWDRGWKGKIASAVVRVPPLRRFSQMIVLEAEPATEVGTRGESGQPRR